jgi:hypothetical protein
MAANLETEKESKESKLKISQNFAAALRRIYGQSAQIRLSVIPVPRFGLTPRLGR